jgi:OmpA-OmpF porin, OOP family
MNLRCILLPTAMLALPAAAIAQPVEGLYVGAGVGYNRTLDQKVKSVSTATGTASLSNTNLTSNGGVLGSLSVGMGFGNGFRLELMGDYRNYHQNFNFTSPNGNIDITSRKSFLNQTYGGFVNALYDFDLGLGFAYPYVGVGIGYEETTVGGDFSSSTGSIAGQALLGASIPIAAVPGLAVQTQFRFMTTFQNEKFHGGNGGGLTTADVVKVGPQYNLAGTINLLYAFGVEPPPPPAPAPAPVAAPAPAPSRTYLVFFDWDKADLTGRAQEIIAQAAQNSTRVQYTRIEVSGYTDRSGTPAYNQKLSVRRAENVASELVKDGVPQAAIDVQGFGESHPLVPTAAGVREPQNRRVEIVLK